MIQNFIWKAKRESSHMLVHYSDVYNVQGWNQKPETLSRHLMQESNYMRHHYCLPGSTLEEHWSWPRARNETQLLWYVTWAYSSAPIQCYSVLLPYIKSLDVFILHNTSSLAFNPLTCISYVLVSLSLITMVLFGFHFIFFRFFI